MNGKTDGGWLTLPILILSVANSFFFCTQILRHNWINANAQQAQITNSLSSSLISARNDDAYKFLKIGNCRSY